MPAHALFWPRPGRNQSPRVATTAVGAFHRPMPRVWRLTVSPQEAKHRARNRDRKARNLAITAPRSDRKAQSSAPRGSKACARKAFCLATGLGALRAQLRTRPAEPRARRMTLFALPAVASLGALRSGRRACAQGSEACDWESALRPQDCEACPAFRRFQRLYDGPRRRRRPGQRPSRPINQPTHATGQEAAMGALRHS